MFTLVIGASASGKSEYAEQHVLSLTGPRIYVATMEPFGEEAQARIRRHHAMRRDRGFETIECYRHPEGISPPRDANLLLEDLGNLTANILFGEDSEADTSAAFSEKNTETGTSGTWNGETGNAASLVVMNKHEAESRTDPCAPQEKKAKQIVARVESLLSHCAHLTVVTNEVFSGGQLYEGDTDRYLSVLAGVNRLLAARADFVVEVVCGLPQVLKEPDPSSAEKRPAGEAGKLPMDPPEQRPVSAAGKKSADSTEKESVGPYEQRPDSRKTDSKLTKERESKGMIFVTGPLGAGKQAYIMNALGWDEALFQQKGIRDVQDMVSERSTAQELQALADELARKEVVVATETGGGVVPLDPAERAKREAAGRLACLLAARADTVVRVCCGLPMPLKGKQL